MTQSPIDPRHKDIAAKAAGYEQPELVIRSIENGHSPIVPATAASILAHAQTLANDEAKGKALAGIDRIAVKECWENCIGTSAKREVAAIAAPYRSSDPVAEAFAQHGLTIIAKEPT